MLELLIPATTVAYKAEEPASIVRVVEEKEIPNPIFVSCIKTARWLGADIPYGTNAEDLKSNTTPHIGSLALFKFSNGVYHVAYIDKIEATRFHVKQGNKKAGKYSEEWVSWESQYLTGFWTGVDKNP